MISLVTKNFLNTIKDEISKFVPMIISYSRELDPKFNLKNRIDYKYTITKDDEGNIIDVKQNKNFLMLLYNRTSIRNDTNYHNTNKNKIMVVEKELDDDGNILNVRQVSLKNFSFIEYDIQLSFVSNNLRLLENIEAMLITDFSHYGAFETKLKMNKTKEVSLISQVTWNDIENIELYDYETHGSLWTLTTSTKINTIVMSPVSIKDEIGIILDTESNGYIKNTKTD